jgi:hypothetical protein
MPSCFCQGHVIRSNIFLWAPLQRHGRRSASPRSDTGLGDHDRSCLGPDGGRGRGPECFPAPLRCHVALSTLALDLGARAQQRAQARGGRHYHLGRGRVHGVGRHLESSRARDNQRAGGRVRASETETGLVSGSSL